MRIPPIICNVPFLKRNAKPQKEVEAKERENLTLEEINKQAQDRYKKEQKEKQENWQKLINKPQKFEKGTKDGK
jgi:hypothetical protein